MTKKPRKRSAASEVLHGTESSAKVVLSSSHAATTTPDKEVKSHKPVKLTRAKAATIRKAIEMKSSASPRKDKTCGAKGVVGTLSFATGKLAGKTSALFGVITNAVKKI